MAGERLCPTCHSRIADDPLETTNQGDVGEDDNGLPIPRWTDDPLLTLRGFNGEEFIGRVAPRGLHIKEIQDHLKELEEEEGIEPKTQFSDVDVDSHIRKPHIIEIRESIEKILDAAGSTLEEYFSLDPDGNPVSPGPNDTEKSEWTDVERGAAYINSAGQVVSTFNLPSGSTEDSPGIPAGTHIRAIHIEDLRHPIFPGTPALLVSIPIVGEPPSEDTEVRILEARKNGNAVFSKAKECVEE